MSPLDRALLSVDSDDRELTASPASTYAYEMLGELKFVRREAQAEANLAYEDWRVIASADAYAVYRAAQDRADAAQDDLADLVRRLTP